MKMYTNNEQTAKLIELGFEKPKSITTISWEEPDRFGIMINANSIEFDYHYSIGELLSFLPLFLEDDLPSFLEDDDYYALTIRKSKVMYCDPYLDWIEVEWAKSEELIDNLFDACVELKEEGVI